MRILLILLLLLANITAFAQDGAKAADLDPAVMEKMVKIVLTDQFKPANEPKYVYLSDRFVKEYWLPKIENTTFILISDDEFKKRGKGYFFKPPVAEQDTIRIDFGFGDDCSAGGTSFFFKVNGAKAEQVPHKNSGWGTGCSSGSASSRHGSR